MPSAGRSCACSCCSSSCCCMYGLAPTQADMGRLVTEAQEQLKALSKVEQELLQEKARNQQLQKALGEAAAAQKDMGTKYTKLVKQHGSAVDTVTKTHEVRRGGVLPCVDVLSAYK